MLHAGEEEGGGEGEEEVDKLREKVWRSVEEVTDIAEDSRRRSMRLLLAKVKIVQKDVKRLEVKDGGALDVRSDSE